MAILKALALSALISTAVGSTCNYILANAGDGCWSLAQRCGISQDDLTKYNTKTNFCNTIQANDPICCSAGSLPDFSPKPYSNGTCFTYVVQDNDNCADIALANKMNKDDIPGYNNETWGWNGCGDLQRQQKICLSTGTPPFPSPMENALCGPQVSDQSCCQGLRL
jgi:chitinase